MCVCVPGQFSRCAVSCAGFSPSHVHIGYVTKSVIKKPSTSASLLTTLVVASLHASFTSIAASLRPIMSGVFVLLGTSRCSGD